MEDISNRQSMQSVETSSVDRSSDYSLGSVNELSVNPVSPPQNQSAVRQRLPDSCGARCQRCNSQGKVGLDKETRLPYLTKWFFILPKCGHSVCDNCRKKFFAEKLCRICEPSTLVTDTSSGFAFDETDTPFNYLMAGLTVMNRTGFDEIDSKTIGSKFKKVMRKRPKGSNAMFDRGMERIDCSNCETEKATVICDHCIVLLCDVCFQFMHAERNESHQAISFTYNVKLIEKCTDHPIRDLEILCQECDVRLCTDCLIDGNSNSKHFGHEFKRIEDTQDQSLDPNLIVEDANKFCHELEKANLLAENLFSRIESMAEIKSKELNMKYMQLIGLLQFYLKRDHFKLKEYVEQNLFDVKQAQKSAQNLKTYTEELIKSVESNNLNSAELFLNLNILREVTSVPSCFFSSFDESESSFGINFDRPENILEKGGFIELKAQKHPLNALYDYEYCNVKESGKGVDVEDIITKRNCKPNLKKLDGLSLESAPLTHWSGSSVPFVEIDDIIKITHIKSPSDFYFLLRSHENEMNMLKQRIQGIVGNPESNVANLRSLGKLERGHFVLAKFSDECWYRAKVVHPAGTLSKFPNSVVVQFIDYGNKAQCELSQIKVPSSQYMLDKTPSFANEGSMTNLVPKFEHGQTKARWTESALLRFKELVEDKCFIVQHLCRMENGKFLMDLYESESAINGVQLYHDFPASVCQSMVFSRHASYKDRSNAQTTNIMHPQMPFSLNQATPPPFASNIEYRIAVLEYQNPSLFYCRVTEAREAKQQATLLAEIQGFIECFSMRPEIRVMCPYVGMYCLAQFQMEDSIAFYRAIVLETRSNADIHVFFIDFGNAEIVKLDQIRKIPLKFLTEYPSVLMKCKLANIKPALGKPLWDKNAIEEVKKMILNRGAKLRVVSCDEAQLFSVELFLLMSRRGAPENVADMLAKKKVVAKVSGLSGSLDSLAEHTDSDNPVEATGTTRPSSSNSNSNNATISQISPQLPSNGMRKIKVIHFDNPWSFFIRILDRDGADPIESVTDDLKLMDSEGQLIPIGQQSGETKLRAEQVLVTLASIGAEETVNYCRCIAENENDSLDETSDNFDVFLIDYGITKRVPKADIFMCSHRSSVVGLAFQVRLNAVIPAGSSDGTWSFNSKEAMQRLISENDLYIDENELVARHEASLSKISEHVSFPEIYHIDPNSSNIASVRLKDDYVPVSHFLKINGLAITNKAAPQNKRTNLSAGNLSSGGNSVAVIAKKKVPQIVWNHPSAGFDGDDDNDLDDDFEGEQASPKERHVVQHPSQSGCSGSAVRSKLRETLRMRRKGPIVNKSWSPTDLTNSDVLQEPSSSKLADQQESQDTEKPTEIKDHSQGNVKSEMEEDKRLRKDDEDQISDSEEDEATVVFVNPSMTRRAPAAIREKVKPESEGSNFEAANATKTEQLPDPGNRKSENDEEVLISNSFLDELEKHVVEMKATVDAEQAQSLDCNRNKAKKAEVVFAQPANLMSPSPAKPSVYPKATVEQTVNHVKLWNDNNYAAQVFRENQVENPEFDLTLHGIKEYTEVDEAGDTQTVVPISSNSFYNRLQVPTVGMHEIQFEDFGKDGATLFGVYKDLSEFLKNRINSEVDKFINDRYVGGGYRATQLYENMAACALFPEDRKWYRAIFRGNVENKFRVRFADFGNEKSLRRNEMLPLAAFPEVPALYSVFKLPGIESTEPEGTILNKHKLYISKMKTTILNEKEKVFVGVFGKVVEEEEKFLCTVYSPAFFDLRHNLVNEGYFKWSFEIPENFGDEEKKWFENVSKLTVPFHYQRYERLMNEVVEMKVLRVVSEKFVLAEFLSSEDTEKFKKFTRYLSDKMPDQRCRIVDNELSVGQLVYIFDREMMERCVFHRGQVLKFEIDAEGCRYFDIFFLDFGVIKKIPPSLSVNRVHNLEDFFDFPARAVPVLFNSENLINGKQLKIGDVFKGKIQSVNQFVTLSKI